jgi:hypothetical protein
MASQVCARGSRREKRPTWQPTGQLVGLEPIVLYTKCTVFELLRLLNQKTYRERTDNVYGVLYFSSTTFDLISTKN